MGLRAGPILITPHSRVDSHVARVDLVTGYRCYSARQLRQLNRIVAVKDLGLTLGQIRQPTTWHQPAAARLSTTFTNPTAGELLTPIAK
jgi:DNA-binding transcriptional MerR regulator